MRPAAADMFPFDAQAQIVVNFTLRAGFPLVGQARPDYGDFPDDPEGLRARSRCCTHWIRRRSPAPKTGG